LEIRHAAFSDGLHAVLDDLADEVPMARQSRTEPFGLRDVFAHRALGTYARAQGIVVGAKNSYRMEYVPSSADIKIGDRVVTSGIEGIFPQFPRQIDGEYPRGFLIGHIESMDRGAGQFENVVVRPAVDFTSLETVLVVLTPSAAKADAVSTAGRGEVVESRTR
jgi:cell shape-determining protein MreC